MAEQGRRTGEPVKPAVVVKVRAWDTEVSTRATLGARA